MADRTRIPPGTIRSDLRAPSGSYRPDPQGQDCVVELLLVDQTGAPLAGYAVDLWHCDAHGSDVADDMPDATWLRGIGVSDATGTVRFTTVVPGCIEGYPPHMWVEVFESAEAAIAGDGARLSTMVTLPAQTCAHIYGADLQNTHGTENLNRLLLSTGAGLGERAPDLPEMTLERSQAEGYRGRLTLIVEVPAPPARPKLAGRP